MARPMPRLEPVTSARRPVRSNMFMGSPSARRDRQCRVAQSTGEVVMRAAVLHAAKDLRIEEVDAAPLGNREVEVRIEAGGICGSDLHYYFDGGFGTVRLKEPMILGHEIAGTVARVGSEVESVEAGQRVAVHPSLPCGQCRCCHEGLQRPCLSLLL